jgi:hypothetical protein
LLAGNGEGDQGSAAVETLAADRGLELAMPAQPEAPLHRELRGQALAAFAPAVLHNAHATLCAHAAQKAVHAFAVPLFGLEGSLDGGPLMK